MPSRMSKHGRTKFQLVTQENWFISSDEGFKHYGTNFAYVTQENWFIPSNEGTNYM